MHAPSTTFHLARGRRTLTVAKQATTFVGLIDGNPYIRASSPDIVVRHLLLGTQRSTHIGDAR